MATLCSPLFPSPSPRSGTTQMLGSPLSRSPHRLAAVASPELCCRHARFTVCLVALLMHSPPSYSLLLPCIYPRALRVFLRFRVATRRPSQQTELSARANVRTVGFSLLLRLKSCVAATQFTPALVCLHLDIAPACPSVEPRNFNCAAVSINAHAGPSFFAAHIAMSPAHHPIRAELVDSSSRRFNGFIPKPTTNTIILACV